MNKIKTIISGSDGTLVNTLYMIRHGQYEAAVEYMVERGISRQDIPPYQEYEKFINKAVGGSTRETFEKTVQSLFGERHAEHVNAIDFDELDRRLGPIQDRLAPLYVHPFYGLNEMLDWMGKEGLSLGVVTSGSQHQSVRNAGIALATLGYTELFKNTRFGDAEKLGALAERIKAVYGIPQVTLITCDDVLNTKPDPEGAVKALAQLGVQPEEAIFVGDLDVDISAGTKAGIATVGVAHGFGTAADLQAAGADHIVNNLAELMALVTAHNSGKKSIQ